MSIFVIAHLKIVNEQSYRRYQAAFADVFDQFSGRLLAADEHPVLLEGHWTGSKVVLMSFPDQDNAQRFFRSPEYLAISKDRKAGAETTALLVQGLAH